jgi:hypothetical protein
MIIFHGQGMKIVIEVLEFEVLEDGGVVKDIIESVKELAI